MHSAYISTVIWQEQRHDAAAHAYKLAEAITAQGGGEVRVSWLEEKRACDLFHGLEWPELSAPEGADLVTQGAAGRRKKLLISDMDSTLIHQECIDELAAQLGLKEKVAAITEAAMRGELAFEPALRERVALLRGLTQADLLAVYQERITLMQGARTLVQTMKAHGARCVLVSGGFTYFTAKVSEALGFDADYANELLWDGEALSGEVKEPILGKEAKEEWLQKECAALGIDRADALAVGDGANDLPMLLAAGLGVAYHAKPIVREAARASIIHNDLSALLFLQGYPRGEWVN